MGKQPANIFRKGKKQYLVSSNILEEGQALLVLLLTMAVMLTLVLSVASRSVTDVSVSTFEEDALRAFSAAEAGVEQSLLTGTAATGAPDTGVSYTSQVTAPAEGNDFKYPGVLKAGETATFWFVERDNSGNFTCSGGTCARGPNLQRLCWGAYSSYSPGEQPAVLLSVYYDWNTAANTLGNIISSGGTDFTHLKVARIAYDPDSARYLTNNFNLAPTQACSIGGTTFRYRVQAIRFVQDLFLPANCDNTNGCLIMAKVRVLYNDTTTSDDPNLQPEQVGITKPSTGGLPAQGNRIDSVGVANESTRRVNVFQSFPEPPSIFDAAVFSLTNFSK